MYNTFWFGFLAGIIGGFLIIYFAGLLYVMVDGKFRGNFEEKEEKTEKKEKSKSIIKNEG